jgi:hypothetical protein
MAACSSNRGNLGLVKKFTSPHRSEQMQRLINILAAILNLIMMSDPVLAATDGE